MTDGHIGQFRVIDLAAAGSHIKGHPALFLNQYGAVSGTVIHPDRSGTLGSCKHSALYIICRVRPHGLRGKNCHICYPAGLVRLFYLDSVRIVKGEVDLASGFLQFHNMAVLQRNVFHFHPGIVNLVQNLSPAFSDPDQAFPVKQIPSSAIGDI